MSSDTRQLLSSLVDQITTSPPAPRVDPALLRRIKDICKSSDTHIHICFEYLMEQLERKNAQIRLFALQVVHELFTRSHVFRALLVDALPAFLKLACGVSPRRSESSATDILHSAFAAVDMVLPPPVSVAKLLREESLRCLHEWYTKFGGVYKKLALAYEYLRDSLRIDFSNVSAATLTAKETQRAQQRQRDDAVLTQRLRTLVQDEWKERQQDMETCAQEIENGLSLLLPSLAAGVDGDDSAGAHKRGHADEGMETFARSHGLASAQYELEINVPTGPILLARTSTNKSLMTPLLDNARLARTRYLPFVAMYIDLLVQAGEDAFPETDAGAKPHLGLLREALDVKARLQRCLAKVGELRLEAGEEDRARRRKRVLATETRTEGSGKATHGDARPEAEEEEEEEEEFWEVVQELDPDEVGDMDEASSLLRTGLGSSAAMKRRFSDVEAETSVPTSSSELPPPETPVATPVSRVRVVEAGRAVPIPNINAMDTAHRFWGNRDSDDLMSEVPSAMRDVLETSVVTLHAEPLEAVKWQCRAPIEGTGRLCKRMDREICPFHGRIIARDRHGNPNSDDDRDRGERESYARALKSVLGGGDESAAGAGAGARKKRPPRFAAIFGNPSSPGSLAATAADAVMSKTTDVSATVAALQAGVSGLDAALALATSSGSGSGSGSASGEQQKTVRWEELAPAVAAAVKQKGREGSDSEDRARSKLADIPDKSNAPTVGQRIEARMKRKASARRSVLEKMEMHETREKNDKFGDMWQYI